MKFLSVVRTAPGGPMSTAKSRARLAGSKQREHNAEGKSADPLMVMSVEKAFRVLAVFGQGHRTLSLSQVAIAAKMDVSSAQRFTHTLVKLGFLRKDSETKRFELTSKTLDPGYHFLSGLRIVNVATPYL